MMHAGYLLIELMIALLFVVISATSITYYSYHISFCQNDALRECRALSEASNYINNLMATGCANESPCAMEGYILSFRNISTANLIDFRESKQYQTRYKCFEVTVTWKTVNGVLRSETLVSGSINNET